MRRVVLCLHQLRVVVTDPTRSGKSKNPGPNGLTKCLFCGAKHKLDDCTDFCRKPFSERRDFFFCECLCMGCAATKSHRVANCKKRLKCKIKTCSGTHPTCLHKELPQDNAAISNCMSVCLIPEQSGGFDHTMVVPLWVRPQNHRECVVNMPVAFTRELVSANRFRFQNLRWLGNEAHRR